MSTHDGARHEGGPDVRCRCPGPPICPSTCHCARPRYPITNPRVADRHCGVDYKHTGRKGCSTISRDVVGDVCPACGRDGLDTLTGVQEFRLTPKAVLLVDYLVAEREAGGQ